MSNLVIPTELLQEVVASLPVAGPGPDARRQQRMKIRTHVAILVRPTDARPDESVQTVQVQVRDISTGGIGILRNASMKLDEPFIALLPRSASDSTPVGVLAFVAYWEPLAEKLVGIGGRFHRILTDDEIRDAKRTLARAAALNESLDCFAELPLRATA